MTRTIKRIKKPNSTKHYATKLPRRRPGEVLLNEFIRPLGFTQSALALALHVPRQRVSEILSARRRITAETALRLSKLFGTTSTFWLDLQVDYELSLAEEKWAHAIDRQIEPFRFKKDISVNPFVTTKQEKRHRHEKHQKQDRLPDSMKLTSVQKRIYGLLSKDPIHFDVLCRRSALSVGELSATLTMLELSELVKRHFGDYYSRWIIK